MWIKQLFRKNKVVCEKGLSENEIERIQEIYSIVFPKRLKEFLMCALPVSEGFYNWRDFSDENILFIKNKLKEPFDDIYMYAEEVYWCDNWGKKPDKKEEIEKEVKCRLKEAPVLIPVYMHRYMPMVKEDNPPVLSVYGVDVIYYGENFDKYLEMEFGNEGNRTVGQCSFIPFWSEIM